MLNNESKLLKHTSLVYTVMSLIYLWFYDIFFEPNPLYGDRASTASNVGRDHWGAFIIWGMMIVGAMVLNLFYALNKFGLKDKKFPKVFSLLSILPMIGVVLCKNEKLKRLSFTLNFETYTAPTYTSDYDQQTLATQKNLISSFISMKSFHSAFAVLFGVCTAIAIVSLIMYKYKNSKKFRKLAFAFLLWIVIAAIYLKNQLGGTAEVVVLTCTMIAILVINHTNIMVDETINTTSSEQLQATK